MFVSGTSIVIRQVKLWGCLERVSVGYSLRKFNTGAGIGFRIRLSLVVVLGTVVSTELSWVCPFFVESDLVTVLMLPLPVS